MNGTDFAFLITGIVVVIVVGRLLAYSGRKYIGSAAGTRDGSGSAATLVSVVFHLIALGLLALITVLPIGGTETESFMLRLGVLLLVIGTVYGVAIAAVARRRQAEITEAAFTGRERPASLAATPLTDPTAPREVPPETWREHPEEATQAEEQRGTEPQSAEPREPRPREPQPREPQPREPQPRKPRPREPRSREPEPRPVRRQRDGT